MASSASYHFHVELINLINQKTSIIQDFSLTWAIPILMKIRVSGSVSFPNGSNWSTEFMVAPSD